MGRAVERETTPGNTGIVNVLTEQGHTVATNIHIDENEFQSEETRQYLLEAGLRGDAGDRKWKYRK